MRSSARTSSRPPAAAGREAAITAMSAAIAALLALATWAMSLERLVETAPSDIVDGLARGLVTSGLAP